MLTDLGLQTEEHLKKSKSDRLKSLRLIKNE